MATKRSQRGSAPGPADGPLLAFIHIPKCAGTTFRHVLRANYRGGVGGIGNVFKGGGGDANPARVTRLRESPDVLIRGMSVLAGHLPFGIRAYLPPETRYVTFLRDPVERTLSHYYSIVQGRRQSLQDVSLEEILSEGRYLHDNLQTRMLSNDPEPFGDVTAEMLGQAKENLRDAFVAFGLVERFDESLVLVKRRLGLRSILYTRRRTTDRPRAGETPEELRSVAERFNRYDLELYRWATELFEQNVAAQGSDFAVDVAALRAARAGNGAVGPPPSSSELSRERLWELLVRAEAELLTRELDLLEAGSDGPGELRALLDETNRNLTQLNKRLRTDTEGTRRTPARRLEQQSARLDRLRARIQELETALASGENAEAAPGAAEELERLRGEVDAVEGRIRALERRHGGRAEQGAAE